MAKSKRPKRIACRYCGEECEHADKADHRSAWTHSHPSKCSYRQDDMPSINGVHVGDIWRNLHTGKQERVVALKLGGAGTYTDREPVAVLEDADDLDGGAWLDAHPLWSLVEHWDPVTRPGEYPVPWEEEDLYGNGTMWRSTADEWRSPGYRKADRPHGMPDDDGDGPHAYYHAWHVIREHCSEGWEWWQVDPDAEASLFDAPAAAPTRAAAPAAPPVEEWDGGALIEESNGQLALI